jgi:hypothetical protein
MHDRAMGIVINVCMMVVMIVFVVHALYFSMVFAHNILESSILEGRVQRGPTNHYKGWQEETDALGVRLAAPPLVSVGATYTVSMVRQRCHRERNRHAFADECAGQRIRRQ